MNAEGAHTFNRCNDVGVIDFKLNGGGGPGPDAEERVSPDVVTNDATRAGLRLVASETFLPYQYFLIFAR